MIERLRAFIQLIQERLGADSGEEVSYETEIEGAIGS
jgi:hypothetical protein